MVICLERDADLHMAQLMPLPLTVSCFSKIQIGLPFLYRLTRVVPEIGPFNGCVCVNRITKLNANFRNGPLPKLYLHRTSTFPGCDMQYSWGNVNNNTIGILIIKYSFSASAK